MAYSTNIYDLYKKVEENHMEIHQRLHEAKKITKKERDKLENDNQHGELALKLAQSFGTPQEVKKIKDINKRHMKAGSIDPKDQKERDAISNKYYKMAEEVELDEMDMKFVLINMQGKVQGYASDEKDAKDIARRTKSTMHPIKKKITDKTLEKMNALAKTPKELKDLGIIEDIENEGFASDAQRRAAFAQGYKAKGKKGKKEEVKEKLMNAYRQQWKELGEKRDPADIDVKATSKDQEMADQNVVMQLRKAGNLGGTKEVKFGDGKKVKVKPQIAQRVMSKMMTLRTTQEKEKFQQQIGKSYRDLLNALK